MAQVTVGYRLNELSCSVKYLKMRFLVFLSLLFSLPVLAEDESLAKLFEQQDIYGTIMISALHSGHIYVHNESRAKQRFTAASTFKILNTLIALEEKVISGINGKFKLESRPNTGKRIQGFLCLVLSGYCPAA